MKKIIALVLALVLAFCVAVPVFAVKKIIDLKDHIVQVIADVSTEIDEPEQSEAPEEPVTDEHTETAEESVADEQTEPTEEPVATEQPEAPSDSEEPAQEEKLGYFGYLKKHIRKGVERAKIGVFGTMLISVAPFVGLFPVYGWMFAIFTLVSPFIAVFGIGEMIFSPIIAGVELYCAE